MKPRLWMLALAGLVWLGACGSTPHEVVLTESDNGSAITLKAGQVLVVRLAANPTTGYAWNLSAVDEAVLRPAGEAGYTPEPASQERLGAGGTAEWRFVAAGSGATTLKLVYARPWEKPPQPVQTFSVTVTVQP